MLLLLACTRTPVLTPDHGSATGYTSVELAWDGGVPSDVTLGGVHAWVLDDQDGRYTLEIQGSPNAGPADLRFISDGDVVEAPSAYVYAEPADPAFDRMVAIGASIGAGMQSAGLTATMARQSAPAVFAQLAGAYLGLPLLAEGLFLPLATEDVGEACDLPSYDNHLVDAFADALDAMRDDDGELDWARGRRDAALEVRALAAPGAGLDELANGPPEGDVAALFFAHLLHEPEGELTDLPQRSQLGHLVERSPTFVLAVDLLGNDLIDALTDDAGLDPSQMRSLDETRPALRQILEDAAGTGAWVFLADQPRPSLLPLAADAAARSRAAGATEEEITADLAEIDAMAAAYSAALVEDAAAWDRVVVIPLAASVETLAAEGLEVEGTRLTTAALDGLVGLDGIHFTATANAWLANLVADAVDDALGTDLPRADLAAVLATDPYSPAALEGVCR